MFKLTRVLTAGLVVSLLASTGLAADPSTRDYFIGSWGLGSPNECQSRDTMSFFETGAWAITNGGGNPVEVIGVWRLEGNRVLLDFAELGDTGDVITVDALITEAEETHFTLIAPAMPDGSQTVYRCDY